MHIVVVLTVVMFAVLQVVFTAFAIGLASLEVLAWLKTSST